MTASVTSRVILEHELQRAASTQQQGQVYADYVSVQLRVLALQLYTAAVDAYRRWV